MRNIRRLAGHFHVMAAALLLAQFAYAAAIASEPPEDAPIPANVKALTKRARSGDKHAQYQLGECYERGLGVRKSLRRAIIWYRLAAADSYDTNYVYTPPIGKLRGQVTPMRSGLREPGLAIARARLAILERQRGGTSR